MAEIKTVIPELPKPWGYARNVDGSIQISVGPDRPSCNERGGGYFTPWAAMYGGDMMIAYAESAVLSANAGEVDATRRYEIVRKLNVTQFIDLYNRSIAGEGWFDDLVDQLGQQAIDAGKV